MLKKTLAISAVALALAIPAGAANAASVLTNGDFSDGLNGWSTYTTANGVIGTPTVVSFDVDGVGGVETAARLNVGRISDFGVDVPRKGGGLSQTFNLASATDLVFSADFAASAGEFGNVDAGLFSVLIDGVEVVSQNLGYIYSDSTLRGSFAFSQTLAAGSHSLSIQAARQFLTSDSTPYQYFANVSLEAATGAVPEPATWALLILGFGAIGGAMRRREQVSYAFS